VRSLAVRARDAEQMDDPLLGAGDYAAVLADLGRVNRWTLAARPTLAFLRRATRGSRRFSLLDVGFGEGAMLRRIASWARGRGIDAELVGIDLNEKSAAVARAATSPGVEIDWRTGDYRTLGNFDFVISSLVAHHMTDDELAAFIAWMEANARRGWMVNDLHRHRLAYAAYPPLARLLRLHPIVRADGRLSIARAFRRGEWLAVLARAGVGQDQARVVRRFPFRLCVERLR
jgi:2-polyprenyl-3-methyl-5-hydroxy-6-metoxy-1,4-benzoquinol methylase